jgi:hypothetical protein
MNYTTDSRNTPSSTNLEEEEVVDAPGNDGVASMPEQIKRRLLLLLLLLLRIAANQPEYTLIPWGHLWLLKPSV